jgi:prepilin-type processing-associated H-X9-DG protein
MQSNRIDVQPQRGSRRSGLTLTELLVATTATSLLMGMLLPALAKSRESARQVTCATAVSRIAKGFTSFDTSRGDLPGWRNVLDPYTSTRVREGHAGNGTGPGADPRSGSCVSWTVMILPFLGETEIYDWYAAYAPGRVADNVASKRISGYVCPVAADDMTSPSPLCFFANGGTGGLALEGDPDYSGRGKRPFRQFQGDGVCLDAAGNVAGQPWYVTSGGAEEYSPGQNSLVDIADGDGTSTTLLVTERTGEVAPTDVSWADHPQPAMHGADRGVKTLHVVMHTRGIHPGYGQPGGGESLHATMNTWMKRRGDNSLRYPSSRHAGGFMAAFCDGHVQFVADSIDEWVYTQLLTSDSRPGRISFRVGMFQKRPTGVSDELEPYFFSESDLAKR